ncbi:MULTISPECIES: hypothetical protein [Streptomyces]|uniref:DUF2808 domain-containing protein n=1 Tax=Streptomyces sudanensis TaxID=436397 RepID=A0ABY4TH46_9ACTN|nr:MULTISPECIES: hypothetical protein [Streptomyces]MCP9958968.1 hypothetical protein [Streptomyces sudanensis]MCP9988037.1 hypothetical protein [Streptomyces sudanensis]MCQ0000557.1 hypothetical protein [Streptomyces sudanensis]URN16142.1 hypothetical protein MW084_09485 [Streptomyces sudanensis]
MRSSNSELVWQGRIHLGDEPGTFGDADYPGLTMELPLTLRKTDPSGPDTTKLVLATQNAETYAGYPGHLITVTHFRPAPGDPNHFTETVIATARLQSSDNNRKEIPLTLPGTSSSFFISVRVRVDTEVPPGLYDDFVVTHLFNRAPGFAFVADFGFRA